MHVSGWLGRDDSPRTSGVSPISFPPQPGIRDRPLRKKFAVKPGGTLDLGEIRIEKPQSLLR